MSISNQISSKQSQTPEEVFVFGLEQSMDTQMSWRSSDPSKSNSQKQKVNLRLPETNSRLKKQHFKRSEIRFHSLKLTIIIAWED